MLKKKLFCYLDRNGEDGDSIQANILAGKSIKEKDWAQLNTSDTLAKEQGEGQWMEND